MNKKEILKAIKTLAIESSTFKKLLNDLNDMNNEDRNEVLTFFENRNIQNKSQLVKLMRA